MPSRLPQELHSSAHQVLFDNTVIGEYEIHILRGTQGPVLILEETPHSPLPMEYLSEQAVIQFLTSCPNSRARFFEHHQVGGRELWVEVYVEGAGCVRRPSSMAVIEAACGVDSATTKQLRSNGSA